MNCGHRYADAERRFDCFGLMFEIGEEYYKCVVNTLVDQRRKLSKDIRKTESFLM